MKREVEDFIREEESAFRGDDSVVGTCDYCGALIRIGESTMVYYNSPSGSGRLCEKCYNSLTPDEVLDLVGVWNQTGDAEEVEPMLTAKSLEDPS